jgi:hypothetical protein
LTDRRFPQPDPCGNDRSDSGHAAGERLRDYRDFADTANDRNALLIECGQHWERSSADLVIESAYRFLAALEMIDAGIATEALAGAQTGAQRGNFVVMSPDAQQTCRSDNQLLRAVRFYRQT